MADQGPSIIPPFTKPVWPIRDQALLRSDESLQQPYLPHGNGDLKHARKRPTISHLFSFLCSHSNLTPMPVMSKLWWSERRVTNSSSCNSVALRSMAFCKRLHKCSCLEPLLQLVFLFCSSGLMSSSTCVRQRRNSVGTLPVQVRQCTAQ